MPPDSEQTVFVSSNNDNRIHTAGKMVEAMTQPPLLKITRRVPTKEGRDHTLRTAPAASDPDRRRKRVRHGKSVEWLRAYLVSILNRTYKGIWTEIDLNKVFNARGYSLSWGRELWRRLKLDPHFNRLVKVRYVQKRLHRNGCFVIIIALRRKLRWDQEPLFEHRDGSSRHVRPELRSSDMERDCPVSPFSHINGFSSQGTAAKNNDASVENESSAGASVPATATPTTKAGQPGEKTKTPTCTFNIASSNNVSRNNNSWEEGRLLTLEGRKRISGKARWLLLQCRGRHWDNCKVEWRGDHAWIFCLTALRDGHDALMILRAWDYAIHTAHADAVDGLARVPSALALSHARRWLGEHTRGTQTERVQAFYRSKPLRRKFKPQPKPKMDSLKQLEKMTLEIASAKHVNPLGDEPPSTSAEQRIRDYYLARKKENGGTPPTLKEMVEWAENGGK